MGTITCSRYHDISCGHRVVGHEGKCRHLHGHNYRFHFTCQAQALDKVGRVVDFSCIKQTLCEYLEQRLDHKFIMWEKDPLAQTLRDVNTLGVVLVPFNPTAENLAKWMVEDVAPELLAQYGVTLVECVVEETAKCKATYKL